MALAEKGIAEMVLAEIALAKEDDVAEKVFLAVDTPRDAVMRDAAEEKLAAEREAQEYHIGSPDAEGVADDEIGSPEHEGVDKPAVPAKATVTPLLDADTVKVETALAMAMSGDRSRGNALETSHSPPFFTWSQVLQTTGTSSEMEYDPISLSQCEGFLVSQFLPETSKHNVVTHRVEVLGLVARIPFSFDGVQGGSNRGDTSVGLGIGKLLLPCPSMEEDLKFFAEARAAEYSELLWSLPGVYDTLVEKQKLGKYFLDVYAIMDPAAHPLNTTNAPEWAKYPELSHKAVYDDPQEVARKLGLVVAIARFRYSPVMFFCSTAAFSVGVGSLSGELSGEVSGNPSRGFLGRCGGVSEGTVGRF